MNLCEAFHRQVGRYTFFYKKIFCKKMSLKHPKTLRRCSENFQPQMAELQFLKPLILRKSQPNFLHYVEKIEAQAKKWFSYKKSFPSATIWVCISCFSS